MARAARPDTPRFKGPVEGDDHGYVILWIDRKGKHTLSRDFATPLEVAIELRDRIVEGFRKPIYGPPEWAGQHVAIARLQVIEITAV